MRWFIGILILANLAIFAWSSLQRPALPPAPLAQPGVGNIRLLREVAPESSALPGADREAAVTQAAAAPPELVLAPAQAEAASAAAPKPEPEPEPEPEPQAAPIQAPPQAAPEPSCGRLAYFDDRASAQQAVKQLQAQQIEASMGEESDQQIVGYWVLIPALSDRAAGKAKLAELKAAGVKDVWLFAAGSLKNAISLGLFSSETNARRRLKQVEKAGFRPVMRAKKSEKKRFWLDYVLPPGIQLPSLALPGGDKLEQQDHACLGRSAGVE